MTHRIYSKYALVLALMLPAAALADVTGTPTVSSGSDFSFDNGASASSGGDIKFTGTSITVVGSAMIYDLGSGGSTTYSAFPVSDLPELASEFNTKPLNGGSLAAGEVFAVHTNGGNYALVLIVSVSSSSLKLQYDAVGSTVTGGTPTPGISAVLDAGSYTSSIAQGSVFVVKGTNLSPAGLSPSGLTSSSYPLPTSSNNVSISIAPLFGGSAVPAYIIYLYNLSGVNQLAALLPSTVSPGTYNLTVTNGTSTSTPSVVTVVARKPGLITQDSTGNGLVVAQNYISASELDINRFTKGSVNGSTISPAYPGQTLIVWLTGMGPVPFADNVAPDGGQGYDFTKNGVTVVVYVGGVAITPFYGGRAPCCAGEDQIDFTLPSNVPTGCAVAFQVSVNGNLSQATFVSIAPNASAAACVQTGFTTSQLQSYDNGATTTSGSFSIQTEVESAAGSGSFTSYQGSGAFKLFSGFELPGITGAFPAPAGGCTVIPLLTNNGISTAAIGVGTLLDAGTVTLTGPSASSLTSAAFTETSNAYSLSIGELGVPPTPGALNGSLPAGTYTLKGAGGKDVGAFNTSVTLGAPFVITGGLPTTVTRGSGMTLNWSGGNSSDVVQILGFAATISGTGVNMTETGAEFLCYTTVGQGSFNVSASILNQLPAISATQETNTTGEGSLIVTTAVTPSDFSAPLTAGGSISNAMFQGSTYTSGSVVYQ